MNPRLLLAGGGAGVVVLLVSLSALMAADSHRRRIALRITERVTPLAPARAPARPLAEQLGLTRAFANWQPHLAGLCGFKLDRQDAYPLRLPLLLLLAAIPAVVIDRIGTNIIGFSLDLALPVIWLGCTQMIFRHFHARHADKLYRQFPDVLSMIVRTVRAGIPLHEALRVAARESLEPTARTFARVADQMAIGIRLEEALREAAGRTGVAEYAFFTVALSLQAQTGGSLAETLDNLADVIRKRVALRLRAIALASEARTSAYVLAALPVVAGLALSVINYPYIRPLFDTRSGNRVLYSAIGMLCLAGVVIRTMIQRSLR